MATTSGIRVGEVGPSVAAGVASTSAVSPDLLQELQRLQKTAQKITSILDLDQLIDNVVNDVAHSFGCVEASVYLHDEERGEMGRAGGPGGGGNNKGNGLKVAKEGSGG